MHLFVYGTLKSNFSNDFAQYLHNNAKLVGTGSVFGRLFLLGWYPGLILDEEGYEIKGEIYQIETNQEKLLKQLDEYEGVDLGDYRRVLRKVWVGAQQIDCWIYESLLDSDVELKTGEFLGVSN